MRRTLGLIALLALIMAAFAAPARAAGASMTVNPGSITQGDIITLGLSGFAPKEVISFWLTYPDYSVEASGDLVADADGTVIGYMYISVGMPVGNYSVSARGNNSGLLASAAVEVKAAAGAPASPGVSISVEQQMLPQGYCFYFDGAGYSSEETISVWLRMPDGSVSSDGLEVEFAADTSGGFGYTVCFGSQAAEGSYAFTAYGNTSNRTGIVEFQLERGDYIAAPSGASLIVNPQTARQLDTVSIIGAGFVPGEHVSIWITLPNGVVLSLTSGYTVDGTFQEDVVLPPLPVGTHYISAYGESSGVRAVATLELLPGDAK